MPLLVSAQLVSAQLVSAQRTCTVINPTEC
jgi:hypothetical protein